MADAVATQILSDGPKFTVLKLTNVSDGSGESAVVKGMKVQILWNASTNLFCIELGENQSGEHDYSVFGGLTNNAGGGKNGDVLFTTVGHTSADTYTVILYLRKKFA
mgnify:CR=1 FL=1